MVEIHLVAYNGKGEAIYNAVIPAQLDSLIILVESLKRLHPETARIKVDIAL